MSRWLGSPSHRYASSRVGMWAVIQAGTTAKLHSSYNVASLTDNGAGDFTLTMAVAFASASHYAVLAAQANSGDFIAVWTDRNNLPTANTIRVVSPDASNTLTDYDPTLVLAVGRR